MGNKFILRNDMNKKKKTNSEKVRKKQVKRHTHTASGLIIFYNENSSTFWIGIIRVQQYIVEHTHTHIHKLCRRESKRTKTLKGYEDCVKRKKKKSEKENKKVEAKELKSDNKKDNKNAKG